MKTTILYDNTSTQPELQADWGFSCYIETEEYNIIFDIGQNGEILRQNMEKLNIKPQTADMIFISHSDFDHIGGLSWLLNQNKEAALYLPKNLRGIKNRKQIVYLEEPQELATGIYSTGIFAGGGKWEQALVVNTTKGTVIIVGCSHPGLQPFIDFARTIAQPYAVIGGFHGFSNFKILEDFKIICPTHCTQHLEEIKKIYPQTTINGGVGKEIKL